MKLNLTLTRSSKPFTSGSSEVDYTWTVGLDSDEDEWRSFGDGETPGEAFESALTTALFTRVEGHQ